MTLPHGTAAGPSSPLEALQAFKEVQQRRTAHWTEYREASDVYERTNGSLGSASTSNTEDVADAGGVGLSSESAEQQRNGHRCGAQPSTDDPASNSHYHSVALPMTDEIYSKILSLVTAGLLDCAHSTRAIETELRTALHRQDLARIIGKAQDEENAILRAIVARDQAKRRAALEGGDLGEEISRLDVDADQHRATVTELMDEISAEIAELAYA